MLLKSSPADTNSLLEDDLDVLVAGAGPAGLFAALGIAAVSERKVAVIDAGPDVTERQPASRTDPSQEQARNDYVEGVGGAGLFSDGKLCLSLEVGGKLRESVSEAQRRRLLETVRLTFQAMMSSDGLRYEQPARVAAAREAAQRVGLDFKYYPVLHIGSDRCRQVIMRLRDVLLSRGVRILARSRLLALEVDVAGRKVARVSFAGHERLVRAHDVVLALGKVGSALQAQLCRNVGVSVLSHPMYAGVRLEASAGVLRPLFELSRDPKYSLSFPDGSKMKTHCASEDGQVLDLRYQGLPLVGGHNYHGFATGLSGFSLLWNGFDWSGDSYDAALNLMKRVSEFTQGHLLAQTMGDYRRGVSSTPARLRRVLLSHADCVPGDVHRFFPGVYFDRCDEFLRRLALLCPGISNEENVLYAPAIEWWMNRVQVSDRHLATSCPGLYVCGDGSGWSQGIVHAAATGLLVAEGIVDRVVSAAQLSGLWAAHVPYAP